MSSKLYDLKEIIEATGLPERTVRYYLSQVLEAPAGTPGRKSYYDQFTVDQLMLAQQILMRDYDPEKGEVKPTLREFRDWLDGLEEDEIRRLVEMPYRIKPKALTQGRTVLRGTKSAERRSDKPDSSRSGFGEGSERSVRSAASVAPEQDSSANEFDCMDIAAFLKSDTEEDQKADDSNTTRRDSATDYLDRVMGPGERGRRAERRPPPPPDWQTHRFGDALEIRTRQPLTDEQARQVYLAGELLRSALNTPPTTYEGPKT